MPVSIEKLTSTYLKIKAKRDTLRAEYKAEDETLESQQDRIKAALLKHCKDNDVESVRTKDGTFYRTVKTKYWTNDWESMYKFVMEHGVPEFFTKSLNQSNVKQFMEDNPDVIPPGLNVESEYVVSIRKSRSK